MDSVPGHDRLALAEWQRIRRYAVPARMIAECTEARERGDWRAACAAGRIDVGCAPSVAARAEELLAGLAPDLLRWHLPRALGGYTMLTPGRRYVLVPAGPVEPDTVVLTVRAPHALHGSQRLTLAAQRVADLGEGRVSALPAYLWDARQAGELRAAVGGSATRLPQFSPAGDPLPVEQLGSGDDTPARAERVHQARTPAEAAAAARITLIESDADVGWPRYDRDRIMRIVDPLRLAYDVRRLAAQYQRPTWVLWIDQRWHLVIEVDGTAVRATELFANADGSSPNGKLPMLYADQVRFAPDLDLVWQGRLTPGDLHPLVRAALFPDLPAPAPGRGVPAPTNERIRVRCQAGDWHQIGIRAGLLDMLAHTPGSSDGETSGCFAAEQTWHGTSGRLPKALRAHREDLWLRMIHGGTRTVLDLLDAGLDPQLRDSRGRTLLHQVHAFDHGRLLPRLLAAGLRVDARDREGNTTLYLAVVNHWPTDLIDGLLGAGADPHARNHDDLSVIGYLNRLLKHRGALDAHTAAVIDRLRPLTGSALAGGATWRLRRWARARFPSAKLMR